MVGRLEVEIARHNLTRMELCNLAGIEPRTLDRIMRGVVSWPTTLSRIEATLRDAAPNRNGSLPAEWDWDDSPLAAQAAMAKRQRIRDEADRARGVERLRRYRLTHREELLARRRKVWAQRQANDETLKERARQKAKRWYAIHHDERNARLRARYAERRALSPRP